ncbi:unnamed protein product [Rhizophagus irregularis]|nr:unnamed protein product [Rhizophagus irregularis]
MRFSITRVRYIEIYLKFIKFMSFLFGIKTYKQTRKDNQTENFQLANEYLLTHRINYFLKADIFFYFRKCKVKANVHYI